MRSHAETHFTNRVGWLRAAVLGANDGIISTASLLLGVSAADLARGSVLLTGVAALVAGAMSMAAGEYVSVSSQSDTEKADLDRESAELAANPVHEHKELANIYVTRGLSPTLADEVATQLMDHDALGAHARDELGMSDMNAARPLQAALASATTFALGALLPLLVVLFAPASQLNLAVVMSSMFALAILGFCAAYAGGTSAATSIIRVCFWGAIAMALTYAAGAMLGTTL